MIKLIRESDGKYGEPNITLEFPEEGVVLSELVATINLFVKMLGYASESVDQYIPDPNKEQDLPSIDDLPDGHPVLNEWAETWAETHGKTLNEFGE